MVGDGDWVRWDILASIVAVLSLSIVYTRNNEEEISGNKLQFGGGTYAFLLLSTCGLVMYLWCYNRQLKYKQR